jgi:hypothetical protein
MFEYNIQRKEKGESNMSQVTVTLLLLDMPFDVQNLSISKT